jgi:sarcosine oxidase
MSEKIFDVAVLGCGLMGVAAARHAREAGAEVILIGPREPADLRAHEGVFGSHYDSGRIVRILDRDPLWATLARRASGRFEQLQADSGVRFYHNVGVLYVGPEDPAASDFLTALEATATQLGTPFERLRAPQMRALLGEARIPDGMAGILTREYSGYLDPRQQIRANLRILTARGATVVADVVRRIETGAGALRLHGSAGTALASKVIVATGTYTNAMDYPGRRLKLAGERWSVLLAPVDEKRAKTLQAMPCTLFKPAAPEQHAYFLPPIRYPDGCWYLKVGSPFNDGMEADTAAISRWFRNPIPKARREHMEALLRSVFPDTAFGKLLFEPCCGTQTPTRYPYIEQAEDERLVWLVGCNTYAAKSADELGRLAARLTIDGRWTDNLDPTLFRAAYC